MDLTALKMDQKQRLLLGTDSTSRPASRSRVRSASQMASRAMNCILISLVFIGLALYWRRPGLIFQTLPEFSQTASNSDSSVAQVVRNVNLTVGGLWRNPDGGRWRLMFGANGATPFPTIEAEEGDIVQLNVFNDLFAQLSIHWTGMSHRTFGFHNDGTGGLNQYAIFPRGNWSSKYDTTGFWGLNWYADHSGTGIIDGAHGLAWVAPSPSRPRPYGMITSSPEELELIRRAERNIQHLILANHFRRDINWRVLQMRGEGLGLHCYDSLLVNGKGRRLCRNPKYPILDGQKLDPTGCVIDFGHEGEDCTPTEADVHIVKTNGKEYIMLNFLNVAFEHALRLSIDDHQMWIVANDGGFIEPQLVDVLYLTNGVRYQVLVKLDQEASDYAIRLASTSNMQNLEGAALLRYPAKRYPLLGAPMNIPPPLSGAEPCVNGDGSVASHCNTTSQSSMRPYPPMAPPDSNRTVHFKIGQRASKYEKYVPEFFLNRNPWQLFHAQMSPLLFTDDTLKWDAPVVKSLPWGTTVDVIVQNTLNDTMPLYKHGDPTFLVGSRANAKWKWDTVKDAIAAGVELNTANPSRTIVQDVPPLGWAVIRWQVLVTGATMMHSNKFKYYALGCAAPIFEGLEPGAGGIADEIPEYAKNMPHVEFKPAHDGQFA